MDAVILPLRGNELHMVMDAAARLVIESNRIAPFSVPLGRMEAFQGLRKARFERETRTYFALLYLHNGSSKNKRSAEINSDRTPLRAYRF